MDYLSHLYTTKHKRQSNRIIFKEINSHHPSPIIASFFGIVNFLNFVKHMMIDMGQLLEKMVKKLDSALHVLKIVKNA